MTEIPPTHQLFFGWKQGKRGILMLWPSCFPHQATRRRCGQRSNDKTITDGLFVRQKPRFGHPALCNCTTCAYIEPTARLISVSSNPGALVNCELLKSQHWSWGTARPRYLHGRCCGRRRGAQARRCAPHPPSEGAGLRAIAPGAYDLWARWRAHVRAALPTIYRRSTS
jgi:hypothetical protein